MPPSAAATSYDNQLAHELMDDLNFTPLDALKRALWGLGQCLVGAFILGALITYNPFDSTGDTAGIGVVQNFFGTPGAGIANLLMQVLGWGGLLLGGLTVFAGLKGLWRPKPNTGPQRRTIETLRQISLFWGTVIFGAATLSAFPIPQGWPMGTGLGGWIGDGIHLNLSAGLAHINIPLAAFWIALFTFVIASFCLARILGIVSQDLLDIWDAAGLVWATFRVWLDGCIGFIRTRILKRYGEDAVQADPEPLFRDIPDEPAPAPQPASPPVQKTVAPPTKPKPRRKSKPKAPEFHFPEGSDFVLPGLDLIKTPPPRAAIADEGALRRSSENLHRVLAEYGDARDLSFGIPRRPVEHVVGLIEMVGIRGA